MMCGAMERDVIVVAHALTVLVFNFVIASKARIVVRLVDVACAAVVTCAVIVDVFGRIF